MMINPLLLAKKRKGFFEEISEDIERTLSPFTYPILEVMNQFNVHVGGTLYDAAVRAPYYIGSTSYENFKNMIESVDNPNVDFEWEAGQQLNMPEVFKNQAFVSDPDTG